MKEYLLDTLFWTGLLIAVVLVVRRPVSARFGPKLAYSLWVLPMARLLMPPIILPAWMRPIHEAAQNVSLEPSAASALRAAGVSSTTPDKLVSPVDFIAPLIGIWLIGAAIFVIRRFELYFRMRGELLDGARPVGEAGRIRLIETPNADGPIAFGIIDKVIALPVGFMSRRDRLERDLALEHEMAHHRGHDLLVNMLVQPLFALHWFNPLAWMGWRALRRDQEAACDARVIARRSPAERMAYASIIAAFAGGQKSPRHVLAAPMACPVLGDASIVHRLRSLTMTDISPARRFAARLTIATAVLALPLTASISYAEAPPAPQSPHAPMAPALSQVPASPAAASAPTAPSAPSAPQAPSVFSDWHHKDSHIDAAVLKTKDGKKKLAKLQRIVRIDKDGDSHVENIWTVDGKRVSEAESAELDARLEKARSMIENNPISEEKLREINRAAQRALKQARLAVQEAKAAAPEVVVKCRAGQNEVSEMVTGPDGTKRMFVCREVAIAKARSGLADARSAIASNEHMAESDRMKALRSIDIAMKSLKEDR